MAVKARALGAKMLSLARKRYSNWSLEDVKRSLKERRVVTDVMVNKWLSDPNADVELRGKGRSEQLIIDWAKDVLGLTIQHQWFTCELGEADSNIAERTFGVWRWDNGATERCEAIHGTYQVIRPFNSRPDRYVLEALMITEMRDEPSGPKNILMYTHNEPRTECLYDGQLLIGNRFAFGMLQRRHETELNARSAMRCLGLYVDSRSRNDGKFVERFCLTGIILRGVSAKTQDISKNIMAVPFIAIRPNESHCNLKDPSFQHLKRTLWTLGGGFVVGTLQEHMAPNLFGLCQKIYAPLRPLLQKELVLHTVLPREIEDAFRVETADDDAAFQIWRDTVLSDFPLAA